MAEEAAFELSRAVAEIEGLLAGKNARLADLESAKRSLREELDQLDRQQVKLVTLASACCRVQG